MPWQAGQSGNPNGRPKRKPITDAILAELEKPARKGTDETKRQAVARRLLSIALTGKHADALAAMKLFWSYVEGQPVQVVDIDVYDAARRLAEERGLDPDRVINLLEAVKRRRAG